jgi:hypothetical protein
LFIKKLGFVYAALLVLAQTLLDQFIDHLPLSCRSYAILPIVSACLGAARGAIF